MRNIGPVATSSDPNWPSAAALLTTHPLADRINVGLFGLSTFSTSVTPRSARSTPVAIRRALERYSTWSYSDGVDLAEHVALVDYGDVDDPDGPGGAERTAIRLGDVDTSMVLRLVLGGDNAATWLALRSWARDYADVGLVTLDAHLDMRDGHSNGSPVRQLLDEGLDAHHVVQVGLGDFSNSAAYARRAMERGAHVISRDQLRAESIEVALTRAIELAGEGGRRVYVDIDMDVADRSVAPACPAAVPGGLSADELRRAARVVAGHPSVFAIDITEIDVERDAPDERTVRLGALLILEALAGVRRRDR